jgi:hypothetical protein
VALALDIYGFLAHMAAGGDGQANQFRRASLLGEALNERGRALSSPATHPKSCSNYFLTFAFLARAADP